MPAGPFRWQDKPEVELLEFSSTPDRDRAVGQCRYRDFTHKRSVTLAENGVVEIVDESMGRRESIWWSSSGMQVRRYKKRSPARGASGRMPS